MSCILAYKFRESQFWISEGCATTILPDGRTFQKNSSNKIIQYKNKSILLGFSGNFQVMEEIKYEILRYNFIKKSSFIFSLSEIIRKINDSNAIVNEIDRSTALIIGGFFDDNFLYIINPNGTRTDINKLAIIGDGAKYVAKKIDVNELNHINPKFLIELFKESWQSSFCNKEMFLFNVNKEKITKGYLDFN